MPRKINSGYPDTQSDFGKGNSLPGISIKINSYAIHILRLQAPPFYDLFEKLRYAPPPEHITNCVAGYISKNNYISKKKFLKKKKENFKKIKTKNKGRD